MLSGTEYAIAIQEEVKDHDLDMLSYLSHLLSGHSDHLFLFGRHSSTGTFGSPTHEVGAGNG
jgi:hypothetical protein